jgi:4-hydroxybenzoate polyprenyltransferase
MIERYRNSVAWLITLIRAPLWWDSKLPLTAGLAYALAWRMHVPAHALLYPMLLLLLGGVTSAIYASIYNDLLDEDEDRQAGKVTGIMRLSPSGKRTVLALNLAAMAATAAFLYRYPAAFVIYIIMWLTFTLYSRPPIRLKARGGWGVLCVALGEHFLPLLAVALISSTAGKAPPMPWLSAMVVFAMAFGIRSILWHQLEDAENDRISGTTTLGAKYDDRSLRRLGERYIFPIEIISFAILLALSGSVIAWGALVIYLGMEMLRVKFFGLKMVIVAPQPNFRFVMLEYYQVFFPIAYLLEYARHDRSALYLLVAQLLLFPGPAWLAISNFAHILRWHLARSVSTRARRVISILRPRKSQA